MKPILNTSELKIEIQIEMKLYIFQSVANCNTETQIEMRDGTVEHFPGRDSDVPRLTSGTRAAPRSSEFPRRVKRSGRRGRSSVLVGESRNLGSLRQDFRK